MVEEDLPREVAYLESYDQFVGRVETLFDMPNNRLDLLWRLLQQSDGRLPKQARTKEFAALTDQEAETIERMFREAVAGGRTVEVELNTELLLRKSVKRAVPSAILF